jgi:hypothetical protein
LIYTLRKKAITEGDNSPQAIIHTERQNVYTEWVINTQPLIAKNGAQIKGKPRKSWKKNFCPV